MLRNALHPASILNFRARLANQCKDFLVYSLLRALILDFRVELENQCKDFLVYPLLRASILDFKAKLANRCKFFPVYTLFRASILDFRARLENRCSVIAATAKNGPPAEWPWRTQAGTGYHEGGIILSKKPPERHLSLPQQRSASDSNLRSGKEEWFRL